MNTEINMISKKTRRNSVEFLTRVSRFFTTIFSLALIIDHLTHSVQSETIDVSFNKDICDPVDFYQPYVKISKTRKGPVIAGLYETGKIMVDEYSGLMCINGAAFIYIDSTTEPQIFSHGCFPFNRRNIKDYQSGTLPPLGESTVYGIKLYGVFLLADPLDFRRTQFHWFRHGYFAHYPGPDVSVQGSAFAMIVNDGGKSGTEVFQDPQGPNSYCFELESLHVYGKVTGLIEPGEKPKFCYRRGDEDPPDDFFEVFQKGLLASEYSWIDCPLTDPSGITTELDKSPPTGMPDFRIIDPALLNARGSLGKTFRGKNVIKSTASIPFYSRPYPRGYFFKGEDGYLGPVTESPDGDDDDDAMTTLTPLTKVKTELIICDELPQFESTCSEDPDPDKACELLKHVLTIEEVKWNDDKNNLLLVRASWRKDIMKLVVQIYQKVCPQVSKSLAPAVTRVVEYFIWQVSLIASAPGTGPSGTKFKILNDSMRPEWETHLIPDLKRCLAKAEKMPFYRTRDMVNENKRKELEMKLEEWAHNPNNSAINLQELEDKMRDVHIQFPYHVWLPPPPQWNNITQIQVREHIEAVEVDYNLDWAIDTFWKVFSTVLGYCNNHYAIRTGATFKQLYSYYTEDILDLVMEQWSQDVPIESQPFVFGNYEKVYDKLFGEFVNGIASRYIDACNDGSFWWSDVPDYRPLRPIYLKDGATNSGSPGPVNFYVEHPLFPSDPSITGRHSSSR